jgi:hypothetical protein
VDLRYEGQVVVNPDRPTVTEKPSPLMNTDGKDRKKPVLKPVNAKATVKKNAHRGGAEARRKQK